VGDGELITEAQQSRPLIEIYHQFFEVVRADTPERMREVFRLRYQVYCVENPFEDPADNPDGLERDRYDEHSIHSLLRHRASGEPVGAMRLIMPLPGSQSLPMFEICRASREKLPAHSTAEFSRFAVSKNFRRRTNDALYGEGYSAEDLSINSRRVIPHITLGLMASALEIGCERDIDHVCAIMEPSLLRLLAKFGIFFTPIGSMIEHHGMRQPSYSTVSDVLAGIQKHRPEIWELITDRGRLWKPIGPKSERSALHG
jgi:N-acyl amino acid synthase of PEP-CTERM/exosortase system